MKLKDKLALITGGGRGIGRAIGRMFAQEGARVVLAARTQEQVDEAAAEIGENALGVTGDVSDVGSVHAMFFKAQQKFGRGPDILVNNAGIVETASFTRITDELWQRHIAINLDGTFYCTRAALPSMIERGWGRIINIASIAGKTGAPYIAAYSASKHGVLGLTRSLALEVATKGITVNAICPGYVDTDMTIRGIENIAAKTGHTTDQALEAIKSRSPQNRLITSVEVAALALLLASEEGRGINGQAINVDGGTVLF
jgi:NAD(P)-dependent dehydrogenase (short-subunit alcohol dehydrogenase family)